jgi:hypothetical protein
MKVPVSSLLSRVGGVCEFKILQQQIVGTLELATATTHQFQTA